MRNMAKTCPIIFNIYISLSVIKEKKSAMNKKKSFLLLFSGAVTFSGLFSIHDYSTCNYTSKMDGKYPLKSLNM